MKKADLVLFGRVVRSHGKEGFLKVRSTERPAPGFACETIYLQTGGNSEAHRVESLEFKHNHYFLKLAGIDDLESADRTEGAEVLVDAGCFGPLAPGRYYDFELLGCRVVTTAGLEAGTVEGIIHAGENVLLTVSDGRREVYVPFVEKVCVRVSTEEKVIVIDPPEGLLDLNEI